MDLPDEPRFREHTRAPLTVPVRLQLDTFADPEDGFTANVSVGGMFVALEEPKAVGTRMRFWLELGDGGEPVSGFGEVVWVRSGQTHGGAPAGMGIEFRYLEDQDRDRIRIEVERIVEEQALPAEPSLPEAAALEARQATPPQGDAPPGPSPDEETGGETE